MPRAFIHSSQAHSQDVPAEPAQHRTYEVDDGSLKADRKEQAREGIPSGRGSNVPDQKDQQKPKDQKKDDSADGKGNTKKQEQTTDKGAKKEDSNDNDKSQAKDQSQQNDSKKVDGKEQKAGKPEQELSTLETPRKRMVRQKQEGGEVDFRVRPTDKIPGLNETFQDAANKRSIWQTGRNRQETDDALWGVEDRDDSQAFSGSRDESRGAFGGLRGFASQKWSDLTQGDKARRERDEESWETNRDSFNRGFARQSFNRQPRDQSNNEYDRFKPDDVDWRTSIFDQKSRNNNRDDDKGMWERVKEKGAEWKDDAKEWVDDHLGSNKDNSRSNRAFEDEQRFRDFQRWSRRDDRRAFDEEDDKGLWDRMKEKEGEWKEKVQDKSRDLKNQAQDKREEWGRDAQDEDRSSRLDRRFRDSDRDFRDDERRFQRRDARFRERDDRADDKGMWERVKEKGAEWKDDAKEWVDDHLGSNKEDLDSNEQKRRDYDRFNSRNRYEEVEDIQAGAPTQRATIQPLIEDWMDRRQESAKEWRDEAKAKGREFKQRVADKQDDWRREFNDRKDSQFQRRDDRFRERDNRDDDKGMWERVKEKGAEWKDDAKEWVDDHLGSNKDNSNRAFEDDRAFNEQRFRDSQRGFDRRTDDRFFSRARSAEVEDLSAGAPTQRASFQPALNDWLRRQDGHAREWERMKASGEMFKEPEFKLRESRIRMPERIDPTTERASSPEEALSDHTDPFVEDGLVGLHEVEAADALDDANAQSGPFNFVRGKWFEFTHDKQTVDRRNEELWRRQAWAEGRGRGLGEASFQEKQENLRSPTTPTRFRREFEARQKNIGRERLASPIMSNSSDERRGWNARSAPQSWNNSFDGPSAEFMSDEEFQAWDRYRTKLATALRDRNAQVESDADLTNERGNFDEDTESRRNKRSSWWNFNKKDNKEDKRQSNSQEEAQPLDISSWFKNDEQKENGFVSAPRWQDSRETIRRSK